MGIHWSDKAQIDVVAINWREKAILLGECKWGAEPVGRGVIRDLFAKTGDVLPEGQWNVELLYFARAGFTNAARQQAEGYNAQLIDLTDLDRTFAEVGG